MQYWLLKLVNSFFPMFPFNIPCKYLNIFKRPENFLKISGGPKWENWGKKN